MNRPTGLWPFTELVLDHIERMGCPVLKIEAHDRAEPEDSDLIWGELTPHLHLSDGEYMLIDHVAQQFSAEFGMRCSCGGDPTYGGLQFLEPSADNAERVATQYCTYFNKQTES